MTCIFTITQLIMYCILLSVNFDEPSYIVYFKKTLKMSTFSKWPPQPHFGFKKFTTKLFEYVLQYYFGKYMLRKIIIRLLRKYIVPRTITFKIYILEHRLCLLDIPGIK